MANKHLAKGASLSCGVSGSLSPIPNLKKISPPDDSPEMWDTTTLDSTDKEMKPTGFTDPGKVTADMLFDSGDATHNTLMTAKYAKTKLDFMIEGPVTDPYTYTFSGYVTKCGPSSEVGKGNEGSLEITLAEVATYAGD